MYTQDDPRARLAAASGPAPAGAIAEADFGLYYQEPPQDLSEAGKTWITRGQNFVVAWTEAQPGARLVRDGQRDEYVLLLPDRGTVALVEAPGERQEVTGPVLVCIPPGNSAVTLPGGGRAARVFSAESPDLCDAASNAAAYATRRPNVPPYKPWPTPEGGFRLRAYSLDVPPTPGRFGRIFRCSTLMINVLDPQNGPRDITKLSPHHHDDFEQGSLAVEGTFTHHLRWPWSPDMTNWREDAHALCKAPSLTVIPPPVIHTSRGMEDGLNQLVDIFSPPRVDFSMQPGWVLNADDYPMPADA